MMAEESEEWAARKLAELPMARFGEAHEVAPTAVFLASRRLLLLRRPDALPQRRRRDALTERGPHGRRICDGRGSGADLRRAGHRRGHGPLFAQAGASVARPYPPDGHDITPCSDAITRGGGPPAGFRPLAERSAAGTASRPTGS